MPRGYLQTTFSALDLPASQQKFLHSDQRRGSSLVMTVIKYKTIIIKHIHSLDVDMCLYIYFSPYFSALNFLPDYILFL